MNRVHASATYSSIRVESIEDGFVGQKLIRDDELVAQLLFWDASGQFAIETMGEVPLSVLEELIAETKLFVPAGSGSVPRQLRSDGLELEIGLPTYCYLRRVAYKLSAVLVISFCFIAIAFAFSETIDDAKTAGGVLLVSVAMLCVAPQYFAIVQIARLLKKYRCRRCGRLFYHSSGGPPKTCDSCGAGL